MSTKALCLAAAKGVCKDTFQDECPSDHSWSYAFFLAAVIGLQLLVLAVLHRPPPPRNKKQGEWADVAFTCFIRALTELYAAMSGQRLKLEIQSLHNQIEQLAKSRAAELEMAEGQAAKVQASLSIELAELRSEAKRELTEATARAEVAEVALALAQTSEASEPDEIHPMMVRALGEIRLSRTSSFGRTKRTRDRSIPSQEDGYTPFGDSESQLCDDVDGSDSEILSEGSSRVEPVPLSAISSDAFPRWMRTNPSGPESRAASSDWESTSDGFGSRRRVESRSTPLERRNPRARRLSSELPSVRGSHWVPPTPLTPRTPFELTSRGWDASKRFVSQPATGEAPRVVARATSFDRRNDGAPRKRLSYMEMKQLSYEELELLAAQRKRSQATPTATPTRPSEDDGDDESEHSRQ